MPLLNEISTEYSIGRTTIVHRGGLRRLNPMFLLTIGGVLCILMIAAALIVLTFLPIFTSAKGNQTKYQVRSDVLTLVYNLPDRLSILPMNWTYTTDEFEENKISILQNLLQDQLYLKKITKKTSITVMDAAITRHKPSATNLLVISPIILDHNNKTAIVITQSDSNTQSNSTTQLIVSVMLRYALECTQRCQTNLKESIFAKTFHSLELPVDTFQALFLEELKTSTNKIFPSSLSSTTTSTTLTTCIINPPSSILASSMIMAVNYEAESSINKFISTTIQSCSVCSGKQKVGNIGFVNELIFRQITSQYGGSTIIIFYYTTDRIRSAEIIVNDRLPSINATFPAMSAKQNIGSLPITLTLCQGYNSIRIYNPYDYTPEFDRIIVY